ncbi:MAG: aminotransferase class IV [Alphaproteobacteria bacterium]|nr:aminotransferase class IV [Alphaproteobacteria bacterium]
MPLCFVKDRFTDAQDASVSITERGFRFGDGVFETVRLRSGLPYQWKAHLSRLALGMDALRLPPPSADIAATARELVEKNAIRDGILRLSVSRAPGGAGYLPETAPSTLVIEILPLRPVPAHPLRLTLSAYRRSCATGLEPGLKTMQGALSTLARLEAQDTDADDALLLDTQGFLSETSGANLFWRKHDTLYTPPLSCGIVAGTTRAAVLRLSPWKVEEVEATPDTLQHADEMFVTNISLPVHPVASLGPWSWRKDEAARALRARIEEDDASLGWQ